MRNRITKVPSSGRDMLATFHEPTCGATLNMAWTLKTRMLVYFAAFLAGSIALTVTAMAWTARENLIDQVERDVSLLARVLAKTVSVSRTLPDQVEEIAAAGMIASASVLAEFGAING